MKKIIIVCGPTGIGKTSFAIRLAQEIDGEIIGADSMQIYKYMDIGTAKPDARELRLARHHMVDIVNPDEAFDAGMYADMADSIVETLYVRNKNCIVAGGTGLYIKALMYGLFRTRSPNPDILSKLETELKKWGAQYLHEKLKGLDPDAALKIHPNDSFRMVRALEILESSGQKISELQFQHQFGIPKYKALKICLYNDRDALYSHINTRVDLMIEKGLVNEVEALADMGYSFDLKSMQSIGYRHIGMYLQKKTSLPETINLLKRDTRRYAKRQLTWFRHQDDFIWLTVDQTNHAIKVAKEFLT